MKVYALSKLVRAVLAVTVAFWMAGAACLIGCERGVAAAGDHHVTESPFATITADACASTKTPDCCANHGHQVVSKKPSTHSRSVSTNSAVPGLGASSTTLMGNCPLAVNAEAVPAKIQKEQSPDDTAVPQLHGSHSQLQEHSKALAQMPRLPNRGHTYLRCCVLLI